MKTAVDYLIDAIDDRCLWTKELRIEAKKAKEIEKQQIINAVNKTYESTTYEKEGDGFLACPFDGDEYYYETYISNAPIE